MFIFFAFRRRRVATPFASAPALAIAPAPPLFSLIDEDNEVPSCDTDLRPHKKKVVDVEGGVPAAIDSLEGEFTLRETAMIHVGDDIGATSKTPQPKEANEGLPLRPQKEIVVRRTLNVSSVPAGQEEASSSRPVADASLANEEKGKDTINKGDKSGSNIDPGNLRMINEWLTQIEVRMEGGSRTIIILMDRDLQKYRGGDSRPRYILL